MDRIEVLWVDDEIEMLKPHFLFLEERGYNVTACSNGQDALDLIDDKTYEIILLDENMPGLNGLETLEQIKSKMTFLPVIMITKNEEESIMDEAIGAKISDYLINYLPTFGSRIVHHLHQNQQMRLQESILPVQLPSQQQHTYLRSHLLTHCQGRSEEQAFYLEHT